MRRLVFFLLFSSLSPKWQSVSFSFTFFNSAQAQDSLRVLFLGNSYTAYNNLPQMVKDMSAGAGKTLIIDSNMPGGMLISGHLNDPSSQQKIMQGNWDYVVVQEQSQVPTIDFFRYNDMYPALTDLKLFIEQASPCAKVITYMTWGRRFGGQQCDPSGTYCSPTFADFNHMQDTLTSAYLEIGNLLKIQCAPVGVIWQNILNDTSLVLHASDNSHPNLDGSYVAACGIFSSIWKSPSAGTIYTAGLSAPLAAYYRQKSDQTIFGNPGNWNLNINKPLANFSATVNGSNVNFSNSSVSATGAALDYLWDFGDGNVSASDNPQHSYSANGTYQVSLIAYNCIFSDTLIQTVQIGPLGLTDVRAEEKLLKLSSNPSDGNIQILYTGKEISDLMVYNSGGQLLQIQRILTGTSDLDLSMLPPGTYYMKMINQQSTEVHKLVLAR
jgi:hypothetical protein